MARPLRSSEILRNERDVPLITEEDLEPAGASPLAQGVTLLRTALWIILLLAGIDKFFDVLAPWDNYLLPQIPHWLGIKPHTLMEIFGVAEMVLGFAVGLFPRIFGYLAGLWFLGTLINVLLLGTYFDIALRDFGLMLGAFALARISESMKPAPRRLQALQ